MTNTIDITERDKTRNPVSAWLKKLYQAGASIEYLAKLTALPTSLINVRLTDLGCRMRRHGGRIMKGCSRISVVGLLRKL